MIRRLVPVAALILLAACQYQARGPLRYGPWEEGLTLAYEDPSVPEPQRTQQRLQVRVERAAFPSEGDGTVRLDYSSIQGSLTLVLRHHDGGIALLGADGKPLARLLPEGFPRTQTWEDHGTAYRVVGRGTWDGARILPATSSPVGVWVEAQPAHGPLRRTLYLPGLGEVESLELRDGAWIAVNRLVGRGFTNLPISRRP